ncbi:MAG: glycoside hydrolase family 2 protein [Pseudolysinimonas sp.]
MRDIPPTPASEQDGSYPRPQLVRPHWAELSGAWEFEYDDADEGRAAGWGHRATPFSRTITVPFPPESPASGIGDTAPHRVQWYRRTVTADDLAAAGHADGRRLIVHFGAVDYRADVWAAGEHVAFHEGGHTPFSAEIDNPGSGFELVVRAEDDPHDISQPRGKQDWEEHPHAVWYDRTSGIWQPVWLESVPAQHIARLAWLPDAAAARVTLTLELAVPPAEGTTVQVELMHGGQPLARSTSVVGTQRSELVIPVPALINGQAAEALFWSPEQPTLVDAVIRIETPSSDVDEVASYLGFRTVSERGGRFLLNDRPHVIQGVLSQGFWPESHLAAPRPDALRAEVELIRALGFTTVRVHQKFEDPRFLYWTDRLGVLVWEELPSAYEFSATASARLIAEWTEALRRDVSHPSVVAWVPFNESWGVQHVAGDPRQQELVRTLVHLARALDGTRLVISNDGWEHLGSDLLTIHDYENDVARLLDSYGSADAIAGFLTGVAPNGRRLLAGTPEESAGTAAKPVVLSEFGGVSVSPPGSGAWGYRMVDGVEQLERHLTGLFAAVRDSAVLAGWCYTQLTDTAQETNGLADENRVPKLPVARLRAMIRGEEDAGVTSRTPVPEHPAS